MAEPVRHLDFPFAVDARGRTATTGADEHVRDLILQVVFTDPGERANRPEFGCGLRQPVFQPIPDALAAATRQLVPGALLRWLEPVIAVERVEVAADEAKLSVHVVYLRRDTGEREEARVERSLVGGGG